MKHKIFAIAFLLVTSMAFSQDTETTDTKKEEKDKRPVRSPFESGLLINNQTIVIPTAKTLEFDIQHRFGNIKNGFTDLFGIFGGANTRLGLTFSIFDNLLVGLGTTQGYKLQDGSVKWNILQQTRSGSMPIAVTYYGNIVINASAKNSFPNADPDETVYKNTFKSSHRFSYFHQIIIARKFHRLFSLQIAPSFSHYNLVDSTTYAGIKNDNFTISTSGRVKISPQSSIIFEYDYPLIAPDDTKPNLAFGIEISTGSHAFQIFLGSFNTLINQRNNVYNTNDFSKGEMLLGFNITRLWNF